MKSSGLGCALSITLRVMGVHHNGHCLTHAHKTNSAVVTQVILVYVFRWPSFSLAALRLLIVLVKHCSMRWALGGLTPARPITITYIPVQKINACHHPATK